MTDFFYVCTKPPVKINTTFRLTETKTTNNSFQSHIKRNLFRHLLYTLQNNTTRQKKFKDSPFENFPIIWRSSIHPDFNPLTNVSDFIDGKTVPVESYPKSLRVVPFDKENREMENASNVNGSNSKNCPSSIVPILTSPMPFAAMCYCKPNA